MDFDGFSFAAHVVGEAFLQVFPFENHEFPKRKEEYLSTETWLHNLNVCFLPSGTLRPYGSDLVKTSQI